MSKKRGKSGGGGSAGPAKWESALQQATFNDDTWRGQIYFLQENRVEDREHLDALNAGIKAGTRRLFSIFSKEELYDEVKDLGNPKTKKGKEIPANYEICEPCKVHLDTDDEIPIHLLVKLLKWKFLTIKTNDLKRREMEKKAAAEKAKGGAGGGGKKDKKESKSAKGKGKKTPEPPSPKKESKLRKRGDEDLDSKYIDDEPDDGPNHYILVYGFHLPYIYQLLDEQGVTVEATINVRSQVYPEPPKPEPVEEGEEIPEPTPAELEAQKELKLKRAKLRKFWHDYNIVVENVSSDSNIHDLARLDYNVQSIILPDDPSDQELKAEFSATLYEDMACLCYDLIDTKRQYKNYLENMKLLPIPPAGPKIALATTDSETPAQDLEMRYYNDLMNTVPQESVSVELIMHCMLEQIDAIENDKVPPSEVKKPLGSDGVDEKIAAELENLVANLALDDAEIEALAPEISVKPKAEEPSSEPKLLSPHDDIAMRVEHLKEFRGLDSQKAEEDMLRFIPFAGMNAFPRPSSRVAKERSARLQELIHFCGTTGLAHSEVDRALKQFVIECIDLTSTDPNGYILTTEGEGAHHSLIPWDDPYPFFKDMLPRSGSTASKAPSEIQSQSAVSIVSSRDGAKSPVVGSASGSRVQTPDDRPPTPGILRTSSRISQHSHSAVHFGTDHEGVEILPIQDSPIPDKSIDQSMDEIVDAQKRNLDQWCFAEHYESHVLLQVLRKAMYELPYYDTYYHKRDHSLMVVLHNPQSHDKLNCSYWENNLHSQVGFRNYIEHVAESIDGWTRAEEAKYQAALLRSECDQIEEEIRSASRAASVEKGKPRGRSKSPAKKSARGRSQSRSESQDRDTQIGDSFVRADSLKAQKVEMDRIKAEEEEKERLKQEKRAKSASKKASKEAAVSAEKDKGRRPSSKGSKSGSRKSSPSANARDSEPEDGGEPEEPKEPEKYWPFVGYDIGHDLIHSSGEMSCMFPTDGGLIRTERIDFILGTTIVKTTIVKDGHVFALHILDPKGEKEETEEEDVTAMEAVANASEEIKDVPEEDGKEKSETEENEKEVDEKEVEEVQDEPVKESVSKFGSFSANLRDGLVVSYSSFGQSGKPDGNEDPVEPLPVPSSSSGRSPTPGTGKDGKESPRKRDKSTEKSSTPEPVEEEKPIKEPYRRPFQKLFLTQPDGLQVQLVAERDCGGLKDSDVIVVKQAYPQKTASLQECEAARLAPAMSEASRIITKEGNVIRTMSDGRIEVLFADGTVSTMTSSPLPLPEPPAETPQPRAPSASTKTAREGSESTAKRTSKQRKGSEQKEDKEEKKPEGLWQTTLPTGKRISTNMDGVTTVPCKDALVSNAHDPETMEEMYAREDKVMIVHRPDGTTLVEHADGTRITRFMTETEIPSDETLAENSAEDTAEDADNKDSKMVILERIVRVECPGFASVEFNEQSGHCDVRLGSTIVHAYPDASYILDLSEDGERLSIGADGCAAYFPKPNNDIIFHEANQELTYFMRHDQDVLFECLDNEGNMFSVTASGDATVHPHHPDDAESVSEDSDVEKTAQGHTIQSYKQHAPRFFLIHADGSGTEFLRYQDIAEYLTQAESDPQTAVLIDSLADFPNVTGINILRPADSGLSQRWLKKYDEPSIIPTGLRSRDLKSLPPKEEKTDGVKFGTALGQGLSVGSAVPPQPSIDGPKCPKVLEHRQLVQFRPVNEEVRDSMYDCLRQYALFVKERRDQSDDLQVHEPRDDEELMHAADLVLLSMPKQSESLCQDVVNVYEKATAPPEPSPPPTPQPKRTTADWERDRREVQEEQYNREAMKNFDVPPYFQSEMGKSFLLSQAPDMDALMRELAQDPRQGSQDAAVRSRQATPTTPTYVTGNTPSKIRPGAPTPAHATGECSPAPVRPTAPTPAHATTKVEPDRPGNPTPKQDSESKSSNHHSVPDKIEEVEQEDCLSARSPRMEYKTLHEDVVGEARRKPVWVPAYLKASRPEVKENTKFLKTEESTRRKILTSSVAGATETGKVLIKKSRGFELLPSRVDFGTLREGYTYTFPVYLKNTGVDSCRFKLEQPPPATGLRIQYQPGPVAAGMKAVLNVEIYAIANGVEGDTGVGSIQHDLKIITETHHLCLPISAKVLTSEDFDNRSPNKTLPKAGVQLVDTKSPGSQGLIRPRKMQGEGKTVLVE